MDAFVDYLKSLLDQSEPLSAIKTWVESGCVIPEPVTEEATPVVQEETPVIEETAPVIEEIPVTEENTEVVSEETEPVSDYSTGLLGFKDFSQFESSPVSFFIQEQVPVTPSTTQIPSVPKKFKLRFGTRNRF